MADKNMKPDQPKLHGTDGEIDDRQRGPHAGGGQVHPTHPHPGETPHRHRLAGNEHEGDEREVEIGGATVPEHVHHEPTKGDPVIHGGDAGGPNDGRNITTADLDRDAGKPEPNVLEENVYAADKPGKGGGRR